MKFNNKANFRRSAYLAEFVGIMMGDGCLHLNKKGVFHTCVAFSKKETDYMFYVKALATHIVDREYSFYISELKDEYLLINNSIGFGSKLISYGLIPGNKVHNKITIPHWIKNNKDYLIRCIRGVFDTDGCVYRKYGVYAQIQFKLACKETVESLHEAVIALGFYPSRIQRELYAGLYSWKFYILRQKEIDNFFRRIRPMNDKHNIRYKKIRYGAAGTLKNQAST